MNARFTITYDYLCPFARIANEAVAEALDAGADYEVLFAPFSLHQNSRGAEEPAVWDDPDGANGSGVRA
ncbi:MAG: protein-disulfide isomerase, partial [Acidimicrobiia bacterium]